ncbi:MAG TPA: ABC transporter permease [Devosia sp.]|jgi:peptide/nickel transport system permease protein|uniref:ABC transporter permease n=1 Tax=Devosia sp. TaxID=1871048 RepID=UPI002DDCF788|nr:ABC transporter permease [Devosia sp.]HEV2514042.1 ABC transporter permease [Devosia sp.]
MTDIIHEPSRLALALDTTRYWLRRLAANKSFLLGAILFGSICLVTVLAPLITSVDPNALSVRNRFKPPSEVYLFGTDNLGRDMLSRVLNGARLSLGIGFAVVILNAVFGVLLGAIAGYYRRLDDLLMRIADALMAFPAVLLAIGIAAALGPSAATAIIALAVVYIPRTARVVRASILVARELDYVQAARAAGARDGRILWHHIMPNCMAPLIVQLSFVFAYAVLSEAVLSFLGLSAPPTVPSWGVLIAEGRTYLREAAWLTVIPGIAIATTVLGLNLLGDGLRDVLDPRMKVEQ